MALTLYVVHGSHPCAAVARALELKRLTFRVVELPPPMHAAFMRARFGVRTVPAVRFDGGERLSGSRAIMRRLDELVADPPLYPAGEVGARVAAADEWGDEVYQPIARRLLWPAFARSPRSMAAYQQGSRLPATPTPVLVALAPVVTRIERRLNGAGDEAARADLRALPGHLDRIDAWIADGTLGAGDVNAADLQIASTTRLLLTIGDVAALIAGRPTETHSRTIFPAQLGSTPVGTFPAEWLAPAGA